MISSTRLDVVICTYNNAALLDRTLDALSGQQHPDEAAWRCLVVDNNSTDDTASVVDRHLKAGRIPGLRRVVEKVQGLTPARACGVRSTDAPWIAFVDDDCVLSSDWVANALEIVSSYPDLGALGGRVVLEWERNPPKWIGAYGYCFAEQELGDEACTAPFLVGAGLVVSRAALVASGWSGIQLVSDRIGKRLVSGGDVEMVLRVAAAAGGRLRYSPRLVLGHWVPEARTARRYVARMHVGLGGSAAQADALIAKTATRWLSHSFARLGRESLQLVRALCRIPLGRARSVDVFMRAAFLCGYAIRMVRLITPGGVSLRELVGAAAPRSAESISRRTTSPRARPSS